MAEDLSIDEKLKIASEFLLESPPGEFNDVLNDVRLLVNNDQALQEGVLPAVEKYNREQYMTVKSPGHEHEIIISEFNHIDGKRYLDPKSKEIVTVDHMRLTASDPEPFTNEPSNEETRAAIEIAVKAYVSDHYPHGVYGVYSKDNTVTICVVDNKYNPNNFWNGRWRSTWSVSGSNLKGDVKVNVHYYEDGNVQLNTSNTFSTSIATNSDVKLFAKEIIKQIEKLEGEFQTGLNSTYAQLSDNAFKSLRRALPVTKTKVDWNKIANYKIGTALSTK